MVKKIIQIVDSISDWSGKIVSFLIYAGIIVLAFEVVSRHYFGAPTVWAHGYTQRIFASYFVLIGAYTLFKDAHVRVDIIHQQVSLRKRAFLDIFNYTLLLVWAAVLVYEGTDFFLYSWHIGETDEGALRHPVYPVKFFLVVGVALLFLQGISKIVKSFITLIRGVQYES